MISLFLFLLLLYISIKKKFSTFKIIILVLISFVSFFVFYNHFEQIKAQQNQLSNNKIENAQVDFLGNFSFADNKATGTLRYDDKEFKFSYYNNSKDSSSVLHDIVNKTCYINAEIKPLKHLYTNKSQMLIKQIDYGSCYDAKNNLISTMLNKHKVFVERKLNALNIKNSDRILALITGDTSVLNQNYLEKIKEIGIYHLSAVSGTHVAILICIISFVLNRFKIPIILIKITLIIVLIVYLFYTNFIPSAARAIMTAIILISLPVRVSGNSMNILGLCFITLSVVNPSYIYNIGFQFSFFITFLILFSLPILKKLPFLSSLITLTIIAQLGGMIISVINFNQIQWIGLFSNLIFVPFYSFILFPFIIFIFIMIHLPIQYSVLHTLFNKIMALHDFILDIFYKLNRFKWYVVDLNEIIKLMMLILVLLTIILIVNQKFKYIVVPLVLLCFILTTMPLQKTDRLTMLDVGQGDSILFETATNRNILIDTGGNINQGNSEYNYQITKYKVLPIFKKRGISKLDYIIITHPHLDHMGELPYLMKTIIIEHLIIDKESFTRGQLRALEGQCQRYNIQLLDFRQCLQLNLGDATINLLDTIIDDSTDLNEHSIITYIRVNQHTMLLMGDATSNNESIFLENYNISNVEILKVGHHGSKTSSTDAFIDRIQPKVSLISAGKNNMYHLPSKEVVDRLNVRHTNLFQTSEVGNVTISLQAELKIHTEVSN
ncbi:DNA internalization-related competence protein ComEC/Rec2 [Staphylococcus sp. ACRSN]|uniref:DNA internalization-related competence protein ComEC/Rec2 n=1 Tax=Staphylococcus sp. ACRSN TaxID=2918214 RepID=UPI001EF34401|nr:DNA internalization-related competence protein ComEC/Rec2 [Staphylococcus sp. ACRSN]MCG7338577.1 DNA internalization-related competence protein ComEC/Rec2 [Staphylococcus sp. ACRSN]